MTGSDAGAQYAWTCPTGHGKGNPASRGDRNSRNASSSETVFTEDGEVRVLFGLTMRTYRSRDFAFCRSTYSLQTAVPACVTDFAFVGDWMRFINRITGSFENFVG